MPERWLTTAPWWFEYARSITAGLAAHSRLQCRAGSRRGRTAKVNHFPHFSPWWLSFGGRRRCPDGAADQQAPENRLLASRAARPEIVYPTTSQHESFHLRHSTPPTNRCAGDACRVRAPVCVALFDALAPQLGAVASGGPEFFFYSQELVVLADAVRAAG